MKTAQELRSGNVFMVGSDPMVVQKTEYLKGGRSSAKKPAPRRGHRINLQSRLQIRRGDNGAQKLHLQLFCRPDVCLYG